MGKHSAIAVVLLLLSGMYTPDAAAQEPIAAGQRILPLGQAEALMLLCFSFERIGESSLLLEFPCVSARL
jgi:hypothetical protein